MAEIRIGRAAEEDQTKTGTVPIAATPQGFWCCPSLLVFQKTQNCPDNPKPRTTQSTSFHQKQTSVTQKQPGTSSSRTGRVCSDAPVLGSLLITNQDTPHQKIENAPRKLMVELGEPGTRDLKVILLGKQGVAAKLSVHTNILVDNSIFFARKIVERQPVFVFLEMEDGEDAGVYVETIGLMYYCKELKQRLIKRSVSRVLDILKVAEKLGFTTCIQSCLEYLEAVPWVGEEEEAKVVSSVARLKGESIGTKPVLRRVFSEISKQPDQDTLSHILELVLKSSEEKTRRETKSIVLKLLKESIRLPSSSGSPDLCNEAIHKSCRSSLASLSSLFSEAAEPDFADRPIDTREHIVKLIALEADNLSWLLDILAGRQAADDFAVIWASQQALASLHTKLAVVSRCHVSRITARLFVGIGRGELLPCKDTRHLLVRTWLEPLINDYNWLQHGCRSFDRNAVEEGIGRTILTLPLEEQQSVLLSWLGIFLKSGDNCPNLRRAFEVWWRRTFIRP